MACVSLLVFGSGCTALIYQTIWLRQFRLIFGASTAANAAVISVFMAGLGVGALVLGRRVDRHASPLRFYAGVELLVALSAALTPLLLIALDALYVATGGSLALGTGPATLARLGIALLVLGLPTFAMGGSFPAVVKAIETGADASRRSVGLVYGINTLGAVAGVVLATFWLIEQLGNLRSLGVAVVLNLAVAIVAFWLARSGGQADSRGATEKPQEAGAASGERAVTSGFVLSAAFAVGFVFFLMEIVWYRLLSPLLGGTSFAFGLILAVALAGIGSGGLGYALRRRERVPTLGGFAIVCGLESLLLALPIALGDRIAVLAWWFRSSAESFGGQILGWTVVCAIVVFPVALIAGFQFPMLIGLLGRGKAHVGRHVGSAYAMNTAGSILGAIAGGFGVLPLIGAVAAWKVAALVLLVVVLFAMLVNRPLKLSLAGSWMVIAISLAAGACLLAEGPTAGWRHSPIGAGRMNVAGPLGNEVENPEVNWIRDYLQGRRRAIAWEVDGIESSIALGADNAFAFIVNGKADGNARYDAGTQVMGGLTGALLHPDPRKALVIGLGSGSSAGWLAVLPSIERVDVIELEPAILQVAKACAAVNENVLENQKVRVHIGDARELIRTLEDRYDLIFSEPSNPYRAGIASLYTVEFYEAASARLARGGLFLQWLQAYEIDMDTLRTIFASMLEVFPHVEVWQTKAQDLLLVGADAPPLLDRARLEARLREPVFSRALLSAWRVEDLEGLLAHYLMGVRSVERLAEGAAKNTDDRMLVEFGFGRTLGTGSAGLSTSELYRSALERGDARPKLRGDIDWVQVARRRLSLYAADQSHSGLGAAVSEVHAPIRAAHAAYLEKQYQLVVWAWGGVGEPQDSVERVALAEASAELGREETVELVAALRARSPIEAAVIEARYLLALGQVDQAARRLAAAFVAYRSDPWPIPEVMDRALDLAVAIAARDRGQEAARGIHRALGKQFAVNTLEERRRSLRVTLSAVIEGETCGPLSIEAIEVYEPHPPWQPVFLERRAKCYGQRGHALASQAAEDWQTHQQAAGRKHLRPFDPL